jgi:amino acid adenylation domain-containing protein
MLFRFAPDSHQLVWTFHHILLDGRSFPPVLDEVFARHAALRAGRAVSFPARRPYRDFIDWLAGRDFHTAESFWRDRLAGFDEPTPLPLDRGVSSDPAPDPPRRAEQTLVVEADVLAALRRRAERHELTLNTFVQGAWAVLLSRYTGTGDVVFGVTRAGRRGTVEGSPEIIGNFINTVPLRVHVARQATLLSLLQQIRRVSLATRPHEHTPLARIRDWSDLPATRPLFDSLVFFENGRLQDRLAALGEEWSRRRIELRERNNFPLTIAACAGEELELRIIYETDRFDGDDMGRVLAHLRNLLVRMTDDLAVPPARIPLLSVAERDRMIREWNDNELDYPRDRCVHQLFENWAARTSDRTAVVVDGASLTYGGLNRRANRLAWRLRDLGVRPDELVAVCLDRSLEQLVAVLGVLKAGGAYLPMDPQYPHDRLAVMLEDSGAQILIGDEAAPSLPVRQRLDPVELTATAGGAADGREENPPSVTTPNHLVYVMYTSGSMGRPKGVMIEHRNVVGFLHAIGSRTRLDVPRVGTSLASYSFDTSVEEIFSCLCFGGTVHLVRPELSTNGAAFARYILEHGINTSYILPNYLTAVVEGLAAHRERSPLRCLMTGIAPVKQHVLQRFRELFPDMRIMNCYGPTEVTWGPCSFAFDEAEDPNRITPIGRPFPNYRIHIVDEHLQPVPVGVAGELVVGGVGIARGYLNQPAATAEKFVPDPFRPGSGERLYRTGDLARYRADGNIVFVGRRDNQVKVRGYRIELGEIETVLRRHPAVAQVVVHCWGEMAEEKQVVAYLVFEPGQSASPAEIRRFIRDRLPLYMVPAAFVPLAKIPVTINGKLDTAALPAPGAGRDDAVAPTAGPMNRVEERIAGIWRDVLGVKEVGRDDNFFDMGGDSLAAIRLHARLKSFGSRELSLVQLYRHSTIAAQARFFSADDPPAATGRDSVSERARRSQAAIARLRQNHKE